MRKEQDFLTKTQIIMKREIIIVFLFLFAACYAEAKHCQNKDEINLSSIHSNIYNGSDYRSESISADITGHTLTIIFNEDVGIAHIVIKDAMNGIYIESDNVYSTPECATFIINDAGYYRMDITLSNGEQCYGYFQVEN